MPPTNRVDDPTISNNERLWRRVHPSQIKPDQETGNPIPSSAAFRPSDEMSVHLASLTSPEAVLANYPQHGLAEFTAGVARSIGCILVRNPLSDDPAHALVCGKNPTGHLSKSEAREIARQARWVIFRPPQLY